VAETKTKAEPYRLKQHLWFRLQVGTIGSP